MKRWFTIILSSLCYFGQAQDIELFQQFNGRYDYLAIGNTLNPAENNIERTFCSTLPSASADLNLIPDTEVIAAYLYWAGSGEGDTTVTLNNQSIEAENTYIVTYEENTTVLPYFSCVTDITTFIQTQGSGTYTLSDLDISQVLEEQPRYCGNRTNFAGWSIYVIYEDSNLPLNQVNLFQGLEIINRNVTEKTIVLDNINVLDNDNAKIGFLAWEGDSILNLGETLTINNNTLENLPLNPANNAFNGTNSFTSTSDFYNGDLDVYNIQDNINIGDTTATISLTTQADLIIINNIIIVLNSQLPDATTTINNVDLACNSRIVTVDFTVYNTNSTDPLPEGTPIAMYANAQVITTLNTTSEIDINASQDYSIDVTIPNSIPNDFTLTIVVDDNGNGEGSVLEINENNNSDDLAISLLVSPDTVELPELSSCDMRFGTAVFNLTTQEDLIDPEASLTYYETLDDLETETNPIEFLENYTSNYSPQQIFIRENVFPCYKIYTFKLQTVKCPPIVPQGFSPNHDGINDWFNIKGLYNIFLNHELLIYNRYGTLIFKGNDNTPFRGEANKGLNNLYSPLPTGTYFYVLYLNEPNYKPLTGFVYLNR